jgi:hypothetical protein
MSPLLRLVVSLLLSLGVAGAQSTQVFPLGITTANAAETGLGFNITSNQPWQIAAVNAAGAQWVRHQCPWNEVEQQSAPPDNVPASPQYIESAGCVQDYRASLAINPAMKFDTVAGYGPPFHRIVTVRLTTGASVGDTSLRVVFESGAGGSTLSSITPIVDHIQDSTNLHTAPFYGAISAKRAYPGDIITSVTRIDSTHAILGLGSAVTTAIPTTDQLIVNENLYKDICDNSPDNPGAIAFGKYAHFLAQDMASRGVEGEVSIWNEPPWSGDPWDDAPFEYDYVVSGPYREAVTYGRNSIVFESVSNQTPYICIATSCTGHHPAGDTATWSLAIPPNAYVNATKPFATWGMTAYIMNLLFPSGVNATAGSGWGSPPNTPLSPKFQVDTGVAFRQPAHTITNEYFHPYCEGYCNPEESVIDTGCVYAASIAKTYPANNPYAVSPNCFVPGTAQRNGMPTFYLENDKQKAINPRYGLAGVINETNEFDGYHIGRLTRDGLGDIRQFLGYEANGINPVIFYDVCNAPGTGGAGPNGFPTLGSFTATSNGTSTLTLTAAPGYSLTYVSSTNSIKLTDTSADRVVAELEGGDLQIVTGNHVPANTVITSISYSNGFYTVALNQVVPIGTTAYSIRGWDPTIGFVTTPSGTCTFKPYVNGNTYPLNAEVIESLANPTPYVSLQINNLGHDPATSPTWWSPKGIYKPTPGYTMLSKILDDLAPISNPPMRAYPAFTLPHVTSYMGTYALGTAYFVGARAGASDNSVAMYIYQLSACTTERNCWSMMAPPPGGTVRITLFPGTTVVSAIDVVTRNAVPYTVSGRQVTFIGSVSDNPIELIVDPM